MCEQRCCHSEERSDEESRLGKNVIPHFVRDDNVRLAEYIEELEYV